MDKGLIDKLLGPWAFDVGSTGFASDGLVKAISGKAGKKRARANKKHERGNNEG